MYNLIRDKMSDEKARELADLLSQGTWTHDYPIMATEARDLGLPVREGLPTEVYALMDLYPQAANRRPSVEYIPAPYRPSVPLPPGRGGSA